MAERPPSRVLLILAGLLTQLCGAVSLVLALASLPIVHDLHGGTKGLVGSLVAAIAAMVCGTLAYRGRLIPLAVALGLDLGFGIALPRGGSGLGAMLRILPADDHATADALITGVAATMFAAAILCALAIPSALKLRHWAREMLARAALGEPETTEIVKPADTLKGMGPNRLRPSQVIASTPRTPLVIFGVAVAVSAIGIALIAAVSSGKPGTATHKSDAGVDARSGDAAVAADASLDASLDALTDGALDATSDAPAAPSFDDFLTAWHAALAKNDGFAPLLDPKVFAFGVEANEVVQGRDAVVAQLRHDLGAAGKLDVRFSQVGRAGDVAWIAEELHQGSHTFITTAIAGLRDGAWTLAALHVAQPMPNETAFRLARDGTLAIPDAIPDTHDTSPLAEAMRAAFASKPSFVEARSPRADAFNFGSAQGERIRGGDSIKKAFTGIRATLRLHDAVSVGLLGDTAGWGAANVEFTAADTDGDVTQAFRVLAIWVKEDAGWRIVQTQFSNAR